MLKIEVCPECGSELLVLTCDTEYDVIGYKCTECGEYYNEKDVSDIVNGKYWTWQYWFRLAEKYKDIDFTKPEDRKQFRKDFEELSVKWFTRNIENYTDFPEDLSKMWCSFHTEDRSIKSIDSIYRAAREYLEYASDRMYINRWLYVRLLLNCDIR